MAKEGLTFRVAMPWRPFREDFAGSHADVAIVPDGLTIKGEDKGFFHLPRSRIARLRLGFTEAKSGTYYEVRIWIEGERRPLVLYPLRHLNPGSYAAAMRALGAALEKEGNLARVYTGVSKFEALLGPVLMGLVVAAALFVAGYAMDPPEWWHFVVIPGIPAVVFGVLTWQAATRRWPRPVRMLADLERQLPS